MKYIARKFQNNQMFYLSSDGVLPSLRPEMAGQFELAELNGLQEQGWEILEATQQARPTDPLPAVDDGDNSNSAGG